MDRVLTVPNAISMARLAGVPVFLWLVLVPQADWWAVGLLIAAGLSDWLDGKLARAWNQQSRLGEVQSTIPSPVDLMKKFLGAAPPPQKAEGEPELEALAQEDDAI